MSFKKTLSGVPAPTDYWGAMSVKEFIRWAGISRWMFYELVKRGQIHPKKIRSRTVIFREEAERFARELPESTPPKVRIDSELE